MTVGSGLGAGITVDGRYALLEPRGGAALGELWLADDTQYPGRKVCVEFLRPDAANPRSLDAFTARARALRALRHPNVITVVAHGVWEGRPFLVTDLGAPTSLRAHFDAQRATGRPLELPAAWALIEPIFAGVQAAHAGAPDSIVHGALCPSVIAVDTQRERPDVRVGDFALIEFDAAASARLSRVPGLTEYLAPEQVMGAGESPATDVFALAVIAFEALSGQATVEGKAWAQRVRDEGAEAVRAVLERSRAGVPAAVWDEIARGLRLSPGQRPANAEDFARALRAHWPTRATAPAPSAAVSAPARAPTAQTPKTPASPPAPAAPPSTAARPAAPAPAAPRKPASPPPPRPAPPPSVVLPALRPFSARPAREDDFEDAEPTSAVMLPLRDEPTAPVALPTDTLALRAPAPDQDLIALDDRPPLEVPGWPPPPSASNSVVVGGVTAPDIAAPPPSRDVVDDGPTADVSQLIEQLPASMLLPQRPPLLQTSRMSALVPSSRALGPPRSSDPNASRTQQPSSNPHPPAPGLDRRARIALLAGGVTIGMAAGIVGAAMVISSRTADEIRTAPPPAASTVGTPTNTTRTPGDPMVPMQGATTAPSPAAAPFVCPPGTVRVEPGSILPGPAGDDRMPAGGRRVHVAGFCMDRTEVTVGQFNACADVGRCVAPSPDVATNEYAPRVRTALSHFCSVRDVMHPQLPINCVDWSQASAYCAWRGRRLPTETEWEFAARGTRNGPYPWGRELPSPELTNACGTECANLPGALRTARVMYPANDGFIGPAPAGSLPTGATPSGLLDLAGNVSEWTADDSMTETPTGVPMHAVRGGGWLDVMPSALLVSSRQVHSAQTRLPTIGFRCVTPFDSHDAR